jgi:hypothetical protein
MRTSSAKVRVRAVADRQCGAVRATQLDALGVAIGMVVDAARPSGRVPRPLQFAPRARAHEPKLALTRSPLERLFVPLCERAGLPAALVEADLIAQYGV